MGGVAGLAIVVLAWWWFVKRRRPADTAEDKTPEPPRVEMPPEGKPATPPPREMDAAHRSVASELPGQQGVSEMPG